jgi:hypothetical protein
MCQPICKVWDVDPKIEHGYQIQKCRACGKEVSVPGTMSGVIDYMKRDPIYKTRLDYIFKFYSKVL